MSKSNISSLHDFVSSANKVVRRRAAAAGKAFHTMHKAVYNSPTAEAIRKGTGKLMHKGTVASSLAGSTQKMGDDTLCGLAGECKDSFVVRAGKNILSEITRHPIVSTAVVVGTMMIGGVKYYVYSNKPSTQLKRLMERAGLPKGSKLADEATSYDPKKAD